MAFGMKSPGAADFAEIVKYDARAGRLFRMDYDPGTREKTAVDITSPAPRFAVDFGSLEIGYAAFALTGPEFIMVAEGQTLPVQPMDKDAEGRMKFKPAFRAKIYGKALGGLREFASSANVVTEAVEDLYRKFQEAPEGQAGKIPIVELTRTMPIQMGRGTRQSTVYAPCFVIVGWIERGANLGMGPRTVPPPKPGQVTAQASSVREFQPQGVTATKPLPKDDPLQELIDDDSIPF